MQQQVPRCNPRSFGRVASLPFRVGLAWRAINLTFSGPRFTSNLTPNYLSISRGQQSLETASGPRNKDTTLY